MTSLHVAPAGEPLNQHRLADCPCRPRRRDLPRADGTTDPVWLHRPLTDHDDPLPKLRPSPVVCAA